MITYTKHTSVVRISFPTDWDPSALTGLTLTVDDNAGNELLATSAATIWTSTTLDSAASQYDTALYLDAGADNLEIGDIVRIEGLLGREDHTVKGFDPSTKIATLETILGRSFEEGAAVNALNALIAVDFSDTDDYAPGTQLVLTWTPTGTGSPYTILAEIEAFNQIEVAEFIEEFKAIYPRAYSALITPADRLRVVLRNAQARLRMDLLSRNLDVARIKDQRLITPPLMALVAMIWAINGDDELMEERKVLSGEYGTLLEILCALPVWVDSDGDGIEDDGETQDHPKYYERAW